MFKKVHSLYSPFYPSLHFTLSLQSAVCILHSVCILRLVRSLQSAVRSLRFTLTVLKTRFLVTGFYCIGNIPVSL